MSDLMKDDNIVLEESLSSTGNNNAVNDAHQSEKHSKDCNNIPNDLVTSNKNESVDNSLLNNESSSGENPLTNENNAVSNESSAVSNENNVVSNESSAVSNENNVVSNESSAVSNESSAVSNESSAVSNESSVVLNENNAVSNESSAVLNESSAVSNEKSAVLNESNVASNNALDSESSLLPNNSNEALNNASDSEQDSFLTKTINDVSDSEKNSLTGNNNEESNDVSDSENSSNFDLNTDNVNDATETINHELESDIHKNRNVELKTSAARNSFEAKRLEYEEVLLQCKVNLETLGKDNINLRHQVSDLKIKLNQQDVEFKKKEASIKAELLANIEKLSRDCNVLRKEKEAIVIRYANSEKEVIQAKKIHQDLEKKIKDMTKDRDALLLKLKNASAENNKLTSSIENKMVDIAKLQKENEKLNADCNSREIRIKWLQNKLKTEVSAHQETQGKLEHTLQRLNEMREEAEQVRRDCQEMIKCYQEAEEIKSVKLDSQLKQKLTELEVQKQEKCDQEQVYMLLRHELDALKKKQRMTMDENNTLTLKINSLEKERLEYEQTICKLKDNQNLLKEEIADMASRLTEMEGLKLQLEQEREKSAASLREVERLRLTNAELQSDLDACHVKEGDRLDFVEKLTAKTMLLQSDHCLLEVKAQALEDEVNQLKKALAELQQNHSDLVAEFENTKKEHENEMQLLVQKLAEKAKTVEKLNTRLEEAENENRVLKKRHIASIKELSRELYQCKKRLESYESSYGIRAESVSLGSRASSSASLHISNSNDMSQTSPSITYNNKKDMTPGKNGSSENQFTVDKEVLIERIIDLQKRLAKKTDKIDFLEDHIEQLVKEMRKKSKSVDFKNV